MKDEIKRSLVAMRASEDIRADEYDVGFYAIGYERRANFVVSSLAHKTKKLCGFEYSETTELAFPENKAWAERSGVIVSKLGDYRVDKSGEFKKFVEGFVCEKSLEAKEKRIFVDVSSMDRSLIGRLLASIFGVIRPPFKLRVCYAPAAFVEPRFLFIPARECAPSIPELSGKLGIHQSGLTLLLGLGFEYGVSLGLLEQFEPDKAIIFLPTGTDVRYDQAVSKANFEYDFGHENIDLFKYQVNQPLALFDSLFSITAEVSISNRVVVAPNGPKILAALATIVGLFRAPQVTVLRASLASAPPSHHVEAEGTIVAIDFCCS